MPGEISFQPNQRDYVEANRLWMKRSKAQRWMRWFLIFVGILVVWDIMMSIAIGQFAPRDLISDTGTPLTIFLLVLVSLRLMTPLLIPRQVRRMFEQRPSMADPIVCRWNDDLISFAAETGNTNQRWNDLYRWFRDEKSFVFLMTERMMLLVPTQVLSLEQMVDLETTARTFGPKPG